jgi:hypothetical protein
MHVSGPLPAAGSLRSQRRQYKNVRAFLRSLARHVSMWARLAFMVWTHRAIRLAPGAFIHVKRGTSDAEVAATLAAAIRTGKLR